MVLSKIKSVYGHHRIKAEFKEVSKGCSSATMG